MQSSLSVSFFLRQFETFATEVADLTNEEAINAIMAIQSLSASITTYASSSEIGFPFITMPSFEVLGGISNAQSRALQISFVPLVHREAKLAWEIYAKKNQGWLNESLALTTSDVLGALDIDHPDGPAEQLERHPASPQIYRMTDVVSGTKITNLTDAVGVGEWDFAPVWQQAPAPFDASIINFDLLSYPTFASIFRGAWEAMKPVMSGTVDLKFLYGGAIAQDITHPHSFVLEPIYPSFGARQEDDLVGVLVAVLGWDKFFSGTLHSASVSLLTNLVS
jgi:hypothetical protein